MYRAYRNNILIIHNSVHAAVDAISPHWFLNDAGRSAVLVGVFPESGTPIEDFEGARNISFYCALEDNGSPIVTLWFQQGRDGNRGILPPSSNIVFGGERFVVSGGEVINRATNVTILELTEDLDGNTISCGRSGGASEQLLANYTLRIYSKPKIQVTCFTGLLTFLHF